MKPRIFVLIGMSGSGKTTVSRRLNEIYPVILPIGYTTRHPRVGERNGADYHFLSEKDFNSRIKHGFFLENIRIGGSDYGVSYAEFTQFKVSGSKRDLIYILSLEGYRVLRRKLGEDVIPVAVLPPSEAILRQRLKERGDLSPKIELNSSLCPF